MKQKPSFADTELEPAPMEKQTSDDPREKHIGGYFGRDIYMQLKMLSLEYDVNVRDLLAEALNLLFRKYKKPPIAE